MAEFTDIEKQLMERIAESRLRESLALIRNAVEDIWADDAPRIIRGYPDHGIHHSERLADFAAQLLAVNDGRPLSAEETYLLLAGIYLHDIGMQCDVVKYPDIMTKAEAMGAKFDVEFTAKTASSYTIDEQKAIRKNHQLLTGAWIDHARRTGETVLGPAIRTVPDELVGDLIDVCKYHAKLPITECPITFTLDERGRKQLVAALVRFADELDVDGHRVSIETVKNFRLDPRNAVYWWLPQLAKVIIAGNVITLTTRLRPDDEQHHGLLVREAFIEEFQTKNRPVLSVLRRNNIPIAISADSGVIPYEHADPLPDDIVQALQLMQEKKGVLDELSEEVKTWLEAIGYEVSDPTGEGRTRDMVAILQRGLMRQQVLVRCFEGEIAQADLKALEAEPSPQKWAISEMRVAPSAREYAEAQPSVQVFNLSDFMRLIWGPYFDYLTALVEESDISRYYVDLGCHRKEIDEKGHEIARDTYPVIDSYIDDWLSERGRLHISTLGEFGTGKTWFCRHYAYRQLQRYLDDPIKERLPLLITLRAFTKAMTAQQLINDALLEQYKLPFVGSAFDIFQEMNRRGKLLLILDGFDEMARKVEYQTVVDNFWELAQVVVEGSKVLLTSRTEYFRWAKESEKLLGGEELGRRMIVIEPPKFEVLYLEPFTDEQIEEVIVRRVGPENGSVVARRILDTPNLAELARKPVLIELLLAALPEIEVREEVNETQVYLYATNELLLRNITADRTFTTTADKLFFLCELAWEMIRGGEMRIHYTDIPERIQLWFGDRIKDKPELDHWDYDLRNQTLLQRDAEGYYEFAHKSLAAYFVTYKYAAELGCLAPEFTQTYCEADGTPCKLPIAQKDVVELAQTFGAFPLSSRQMRAIMNLLPGMMGNVDLLWALIDETKGRTFDDVGYTGGNALTLLYRMDKVLTSKALATSRHSLVGAVVAGAFLRSANLAGVDLSSTVLRRATMNQAILEGANLQEADLTDAILRGAELEGASFRGANLRKATIPAQLTNTDFTDAYLGESNILATTTYCLSFHPDGTRLAVGDTRGRISIWNTESWEKESILQVTEGTVMCLSYSPDGRYLALGGTEDLYIWEVNSNEEVQHVSLLTAIERLIVIEGISYSPDGHYIALGTYGDGAVRIVETVTGKITATMLTKAENVWSVHYHPTDRLVASAEGNGTVRIWDADTGRQVAGFTPVPTEAGEEDTAFGVCFSPNGMFVASGHMKGSVLIWDVNEQKLVQKLTGHSAQVWRVAYSPDGKYIVTAGWDGLLKVWDISTSECRMTLSGHFDKTTRSVDFDPTGRFIASGSQDGTVRVWSFQTGESIRVLVPELDCKGMRIRGVRGLSQEQIAWLKVRGATDRL